MWSTVLCHQISTLSLTPNEYCSIGSDAGEFDPPTDNHLELWVGFLLDGRTPARPESTSSHATGKRKGKNSKASSSTTSSSGTSSVRSRAFGSRGSGGRWNGAGEGWMRAEIYLVNPSEVVSAEGVQRYPKGTFGIRCERRLVRPDPERAVWRIVHSEIVGAGQARKSGATSVSYTVVRTLVVEVESLHTAPLRLRPSVFSSLNQIHSLQSTVIVTYFTVCHNGSVLYLLLT